MKTLISIIAITLSSIFGYSQNEEGYTITVTIDNFMSENGHALLSLHTKDTFMKGDGLIDMKSEIKNGKTTVTFTNVKPGVYAILALHDANDNGHMDYEENGMPIEVYGISSNPSSFGPPQFNTAKFEVSNNDIELTIKLR
ncbi:hypothetical protein GCM10011531_19470 [Aquaticitalea lipolytica]|jgi:uncharacterized protein (DUF2141 family)|uniref:DUF2141 domain-containing protein n=1 Tax=Aquaticitalea lipolytica TaxID=1247562 RepID=A0A8J2XJ43_9FLAO|nr:DUF2141 domain-containing protein [Aquaticitalea lipolytica]GFZ88031.1 hypothetical protein GCM10011531_19470 [Aquaticitalea lipolytica]